MNTAKDKTIARLRVMLERERTNSYNIKKQLTEVEKELQKTIKIIASAIDGLRLDNQVTNEINT